MTADHKLFLIKAITVCPKDLQQFPGPGCQHCIKCNSSFPLSLPIISSLTHIENASLLAPAPALLSYNHFFLAFYASTAT